MKHVLIILVTYNGRQWLPKCLRSLPLSGGRFAANVSSKIWTDLFLVDNDSTDGSADLAEELCPQAKIVRSMDNLGFTGGNNLGFEYALRRKYDYVYLINQDAWLEKDTLETLVECAEAHPEYAVLSPLQMTDSLTAFDPRFSVIARKAGLRHPLDETESGLHPQPRPGRLVLAADAGCDKCPAPEHHNAFAQGPTPHPVKFVMAAHWLMRTDALRDTGPFSELFPHYGQDDNWCDRARSRGWKIGICPSTRAVHDRASRTETKAQKIDRVFRTTALARLADPNHPLWDRICYVWLYAVVKSLKFGSLLPLKMLPGILRQLPEVKKCLSLHAALPPRQKAEANPGK